MSGFHYHTYYGDMVDRRTCIYRMYDAEDRLLYVGMSMNPHGRLAKHRCRPWGKLATRIEIEWFDGREAAKAAERAAIFWENPIHNLARPSTPEVCY